MAPVADEASQIENWLSERYAKKTHDDPWSIERYSACRVLKERGIPCYLWAEDALSYYGVPTALFDIHIVVDDVQETADALLEHGWHLPPLGFEPRYIDIKEATCYLIDPQRSNKIVDPRDSLVALTAASDWDINLPDIAMQKLSYPQTSARWPFIPPLHLLLDSLIRRWLVTPDVHYSFLGHISCFIGYLYGNVPILKLGRFADYLRIEHRQYHMDVVAGVSYTQVPFRTHSRKVRESILQGEYELRECSVSRDDERYFTAAVEARLLASLPPPNHR